MRQQNREGGTFVTEVQTQPPALLTARHKLFITTNYYYRVIVTVPVSVKHMEDFGLEQS